MKYLFRVIQGIHTAVDGTTYTRGQKFRSNVDLRKIFREKFELVRRLEDNEVEKTTKAAKSTEKASQSEHGEDVTEQFPEAQEGDLKVYREGRAYRVVDPDEGNDPVSEDLGSKKAVREFITTYFEDGEEGE